MRNGKELVKDLPVAAAGLASGAAMWLVADEGMTPALGFSAPTAWLLLRRSSP